MELRMSAKERDRLRIMEQVVNQALKQSEAAVLLGLSERQVRRVLRRYREQGDAGLVHRLRGRPSNRKVPGRLKARALAVLGQQDYADFGPTLASETLAERHGVAVSRETMRQWMLEQGLWQARPAKVHARQWRERRACAGELVQMDTSLHDWFEGRGDTAVLIALIDDAHSRLLCRFYPADTTETNMSLLRDYIARYGRPKAVYADRASHFMTTRQTTPEEDLAAKPAQTQIQRALEELDIAYIAAHSPQAKGRVERLFGTLQDRLVKMLRLEGIATIDDANAYLRKTFIPMWNRRFTCTPQSGVDAHRPRAGFDLAAIWSTQHTRKVTNDYTLSLGGQRLQILKHSIRPGLRGSQVVIEQRLDGTRRIRWRGRYLRYKAIKTRQPQNQRGALAVSPDGLRPPSEPTKAQKPKPAHNHPWRRYQNRTLLLCKEQDISKLR
jgi:transposase